MAFERRQPSVDLRAFLDPLKPGDYFDCGEARLYGIDEALEAEARRRGRPVGDDRFQLVATDGGLIFCRASIMFAIAARWKDLTIGRPEEGDGTGQAVLPISWPTHGDLQFTVSRRLGSNIFRRWLQLQARATRRSQVEQDARFERAATSPPSAGNGHGATGVNGQRHPQANGHGSSRYPAGAGSDWNGSSASGDHTSVPDESEIDLRSVEVPDPDITDAATGSNGSGHAPDHGGVDTPNGAAPLGSTLGLDDADREAIRYAIDQEQRRRRRVDHATGTAVPDVPDLTDVPDDMAADPLATLDAAVVDEWVDDRVAGHSTHLPAEPGAEDSPTADPFPGHNTDHGAGGHGRLDADADAGLDDVGGGEAIRFEVRPGGLSESVPAEASGSTADIAADGDAAATRFMQRTADGTDIFPDRPVHEAGRAGRPGVPVPEIRGARLHNAEAADSVVAPRLDIRSTLLAGRQQSDWVETLRQRQVLILGTVTIVALGLIALIGYLSGDDGGSTAAGAGVAADTGAVSGAVTDDVVGGDPVTTSTTSVATPAEAADAPSVQSTVPTLRVSSTSVQICHSNYGGCVPVAADVDCEGDGDGPAFQSSPVAVFGEDVYDLDTDQDREACEPDQPRTPSGGG